MEFPGEKPVWGFWHIIAAIIFFFGAILLYQVYFKTDLLDYLFFTYGIAGDDVQVFFIDYAVQLIITFSTVLMVVVSSGGALKDLGFVRQNLRGGIVVGITWGALIFMVVIASSFILKQFVPNLRPQDPEIVLQQAGHSMAAIGLFLYIAVLGPLAEELFHRAMMYPVFRHYLGVNWGILASAVIFSLFHWDKWRFLPLALGGMALAHIYEKSKTIYAPWVAHGVWNGIMAITTIYLS
ncbi:MAG: lysostaphin resistance A-like protein [Candidatus Saccharibacteria bacterium]